jgi:hypothetical protein
LQRRGASRVMFMALSLWFQALTALTPWACICNVLNISLVTVRVLPDPVLPAGKRVGGRPPRVKVNPVTDLLDS